jgi:hypothetical protein
MMATQGHVSLLLRLSAHQGHDATTSRRGESAKRHHGEEGRRSYRSSMGDRIVNATAKRYDKIP